MTSLQQPRRVHVVISANETFADVTVDGAVRRITGEDPKQTRRQALEVATSLAAASGSDVVIEASDAHSSWRLLATPDGIIRGLNDEPATRRKWRPGRTFLILGGVALVVILGAVTVVRLPLALPSFSDSESEPSGDDDALLDRDVELEARTAPPGFTAVAEWGTVLAEGTTPAVAPDESWLAFVTEDTDLVVFSAEGERQWTETFSVDIDELQGPLRGATIGESLYITAVTSDALWLWPETGGTPEELALPDDANVTFAGGAPLVTHPDEPPMIPQDGELVEVPVPTDARALSFDGEHVLAAPSGDTWMLLDHEEDQEAVQGDEPDDDADSGDVLTASADHVVMEWETTDDSAEETIVSVHDAGDGSVIGAAQVSEDERDDEDRWQVTEGWGAYGPLLVDLHDGETEVLPGFQPIGAAGKVLYGELDGELTAVDAEGTSSELADDTARPWGLLDGRAVVVAEQDVFVLPPD